MAGSIATSYWCYMCRQRVSPIMELELKCPLCESGFVEEIAGREAPETEEAVSAISSWPSVLEGMMSNPSLHPRSRRFPRVEDDNDSDLESELEFILGRRRHGTNEYVWRTRLEEGDRESDTELQLESTAQRRQNSAILQLLYSLQEDLRPESDEHEMEMEIESERESESVVLINSFNEAVILDGPFNTDQNSSHDSESTTIGATFGDYFVGPGLEMILQHLSENDPNCYGTPPAQKGDVDALPVVKIDESINCPVCLEDFEFGMQARKMPCDHKFHQDCIFSWLELHSSCPVCRFQLPIDESKTSSGSMTVEGREGGVFGDSSVRGRRNRSGARPSWPFNGMF